MDEKIDGYRPIRDLDGKIVAFEGDDERFELAVTIAPADAQCGFEYFCSKDSAEYPLLFRLGADGEPESLASDNYMGLNALHEDMQDVLDGKLQATFINEEFFTLEDFAEE